MDLTTLLLIALATVTGVLVVGLVPPRGLVGLAVLLWSINMMPIVGRFGLLGITTAALLLCVATIKYWSECSTLRPIAPVGLLPLLAGILGMFALPGAFAPVLSLTAALQVLLLGILTLLTARVLPGRLVVRSAFVALLPLVVVSLFWSPNLGDLLGDGRRVGVTDNPNSLALLAGIWACLALGVGRGAVVLALPIASALVVLSGSRGSGLALLAAMMTALWIWLGNGPGGPRLVRTVGRGLVLLSVAAVFWSVTTLRSRIGAEGSSLALARLDDSGRVEALQGNWHLFLQRPVTGFGLGFVPTDGAAAHVFPVAMAAELGLLGLALTAVIVIVLLGTGWRESPLLGGLVAFALTSMISESWLTGAGAVWTLVFWLAVASWDTDLRMTRRSGQVASRLSQVSHERSRPAEGSATIEHSVAGTLGPGRVSI